MTSHGRWASSDHSRHDRDLGDLSTVARATRGGLARVPGGDVAITAVTLAELLAGVRRLPDGRRRDELTRRIDAALAPYRGGRAVLAFDDVTAGRYADVLVAREKTEAPISTADAQVAVISLAHEATCAARNVKDFQHTGVELVDAWKADARIDHVDWA